MRNTLDHLAQPCKKVYSCKGLPVVSQLCSFIRLENLAMGNPLHGQVMCICDTHIRKWCNVSTSDFQEQEPKQQTCAPQKVKQTS